MTELDTHGDPSGTKTEAPPADPPATRVGDVMPDPWAVVATSDEPRGPGAAPVITAWAVGASGPTVLLMSQGAVLRTLLVTATTLAWEAFLRRRTTRAGPAMASLAVTVLCATWLGRLDGYAVVIVSLLAVLTADAVFVEWRPLRSWPRRNTGRAMLAVPLVVVAQVIWFRSSDTRQVVLLLIGALVVVEAYHRFPTRLAGADRVVGRLLDSLANLIAGALLFVVSLVFIYAPGWVLRTTRSLQWRRRRDAPTWWVATDVDVWDQRHDSRFPFASTPRSTRRRRHLLAAAVVAVVLVAAVMTVRNPLERPGTILDPPEGMRFSEQRAYAGVAFADDLQEEQQRLAGSHLVRSTATDLALTDFEGRYTNVDDGLRHTTTPPECACEPRTVWLIGGSGAFGLGQRDTHTIASELVRIARGDDLALTVDNMAVPGWTIHQERMAIEQRLRSGSERPDLVIFYDGFNDVVGTIISSTVHGIDRGEPTRFDYVDTMTFTERDLDPTRTGSADDLGRLAADKYAWERDAVQGLLSSEGVDSEFLFQPDAFADPLQYSSIESVLSPTVREHHEFVTQVFAVASSELAPEVVNLRDVYDDIEQPLFVDSVHTNEQAARISAEAVYDDVRDILLEEEG